MTLEEYKKEKIKQYLKFNKEMVLVSPEETDAMQCFLSSLIDEMFNAVIEKCEKTKKLNDRGRQTEDWQGYYNQGIEDVISTLKT